MGASATLRAPGDGEDTVIVTCASCSAENAAGRRFCDQCGASLASPCPSCGGENRPGARFCGDCGQPLAAGPAATSPSADGAPPNITHQRTVHVETAAERRLVSVLFADLVSFTSYSEGRDPEHVRETLTRYFEATRAAIERHGGVVEKFIGDAVMAEWGAPRTNEDDAERAVRAALEVVEAVRNLGEDLHTRVAVLTGQAAVTIGATDQGMVAGDLVNTAARLQAVAPPDTVLVGEATMQAASRAIAFEEAGEQVLRGKEAPVRAWRALRVVADKGGRGRSDGIEPPFVGRELELRLLKDVLHATGNERRPRLVSITGPGGIGKSRLAWEFEKYVDGLVENVYWHRGRSPSYGDGIAFWALGEMVRRRAGLLESDDEATTRERVGVAVREYIDAGEVAWVERALLTLLGLEPPPPGGRDALFAAWRTFFERLAATQTTVLLFEDLQWADPGQLDFIDHVMEWARGVPLLVITLARPELLESRPGWGTSARSFHAVGLEPLTDGQMRELLLGLVPSLPDAAVQQVLSRADGIPLYAVETVRMLIANGRLAPDGAGTYRPAGELGELAIPDTLRALVGSRLDGLEAADRALVQDATVLGKTFEPRALAYVSGLGEDEVEQRLRGLVRRELVEVSVDPRSPERGQYGFVQAVIREVAYDTLSRRDRRARHLAAARYFESEGDEELAAVLATHYLAALQASDPGPETDALRIQARLALRGAADRAFDLGSPDQALAHLQAALEITDGAADRGPLFLRSAEAATAAGRLTKAIEYARSAVEAFEDAGERTAALRASGVLGSHLLDNAELDEATSLLERTSAEAGAFPEIHADLLARLARAYMRQTREEEAVTAADRAIVIAEPLMLDRIVAEAFANKGAALMKLSRLREPRMYLELAAELAHACGDVDLELRSRLNLGVFLSSQDVEASMAWNRESMELAMRLGSYKYAASVAANMVIDEFARGRDWDGAVAELERLLADASEPAERLNLLALRLSFAIDRAEDWRDTWAEIEGLRADLGDDETVALAIVEHARGQLRETRTDGEIGAIRTALPHLGQLRVEGGWALLDIGVRHRELDLVRDAAPIIHESGSIASVSVAMGHAASASLAALEGREDEASHQYRMAVDLLRTAGALYYVACVQLMAVTLAATEPAFAGWAEEARARFELLGAKPRLEQLERSIAQPPKASAGGG